MIFGTTNFPNYRQLDQMDCGPACLKIVTKHFGQEYNLEYLRKISHQQKGGVSMAGLSEALGTIGIEAIGIRSDLMELVRDVPLPAIAHWDNNHFVVVYQTSKKFIYVSDPAVGLIKYRHSEFIEKWSGKRNGEGILLLLEPNHNFNSVPHQDNERTGLAYLYKYLLPFKSYIGQLCLGLFLASIIQFLLPFLTQSIVDYGIDYGNIGFIQLVVIAQVFLF